ncbi:hypothetical protein LZ30DRAFT_175193 [Colletotrichum cereale]|nr:hypothetical protein LZ30DRAFT_175193 [Colletotrichum cereale]
MPSFLLLTCLGSTVLTITRQVCFRMFKPPDRSSGSFSLAPRYTIKKHRSLLVNIPARHVCLGIQQRARPTTTTSPVSCLSLKCRPATHSNITMRCIRWAEATSWFPPSRLRPPLRDVLPRAL